MEVSSSEKFYFRWRKALSTFFLALFLPIIYLSVINNMYEHLLLGVFNLTIAVLGIWFLGVVSVSKAGIVLYRINRLKWNDVRSARRVKFLGVSHILIKRHKGFSWWLPLYFTGYRNITDALLEVVPQDNPLREVINEH